MTRTRTRSTPPTNSPDELRLLHEAEVAELLGVSRQTLANWRSMRRGVPFVRIGGRSGGRIRYKASDVRAFIAARTVNVSGGEGVY